MTGCLFLVVANIFKGKLNKIFLAQFMPTVYFAQPNSENNFFCLFYILLGEHQYKFNLARKEPITELLAGEGLSVKAHLSY